MKTKDETPSIGATNTEDGGEEFRPRKGLEDWEMLQQREEPPLKVPYWFFILVGGLLVFSILLTFPFMGVREGYERPWLDWGLLVGAGYGVISLIAIYFFMKKRKTKSEDKENSEVEK